MLEEGAQPNAGNAPLGVAASEGFVECLATLIKGGADVEQSDISNWTALQLACHNGKIGCVEELLKAAADSGRPAAAGRTALDQVVLFSIRESNGVNIQVARDMINLIVKYSWQRRIFAPEKLRESCRRIHSYYYPHILIYTLS